MAFAVLIFFPASFSPLTVFHFSESLAVCATVWTQPCPTAHATSPLLGICEGPLVRQTQGPTYSCESGRELPVLRTPLAPSSSQDAPKVLPTATGLCVLLSSCCVFTPFHGSCITSSSPSSLLGSSSSQIRASLLVLESSFHHVSLFVILQISSRCHLSKAFPVHGDVKYRSLLSLPSFAPSLPAVRNFCFPPLDRGLPGRALL